MFGDKITQSVAEAVKQILATEKLHPNQQKLDVHEPEKDKLTRKDFEMLRSNKKPKNEAFNPLKHIVNPSPAVKTAAKDVKRGSYADRAALMKAGGVKDDRGPRGVTKEEVEELDLYEDEDRLKSRIEKEKGHVKSLAARAKTTTGTDGKKTMMFPDPESSYAHEERLQKIAKMEARLGKIQKKKSVTKEEVEEAVESPFTSYKKPREIESRGGSGIKQGTRYGGGKQKDVPTQDEAPKTKKPKGKMDEQTFTGQGSSPDLQMATDIAKMKAKSDAMRHVYGDNFKDKKMVPHTVGKMDINQDGKNYVAKSPLTLNNPPDKEKDRLPESKQLISFKEMFGE